MVSSFDTDRWLPDRTPVQPKRGPDVPLPTFNNTKPGTATKVKVPRFGDQVDAVRMRGSGLDITALTAIEAGYPGIDKQRSRGYMR